MKQKRVAAITAILALLFMTPAGAALAGVSPYGSPADKIDRYILDTMKAGKIPGLALAIVRGDGSTYVKGYGTADGNRPVTPQTPFTICSVGKTFTALAIRKLAGQDKVDYDAPVQAYIPWFTLKDPDAAKKITVRDLINHKSGLSTDSGTAGWTYGTGLPIEGVVRGLKDVAPVRPAGESEEYSNLNFIILGLVVEKVSGMSYADYIEKEIFEPLGMAHSFTDPDKALKDGRAAGHSPAFGLIVPADVPFPPGQLPAGYQYTSAEDMAKYAALYLSNGYADSESLFGNNPLPEAKPPYPPYSNDQQRYGIYWMPESGPVNGYRGYFGHEGGSANFSTMLLVSPSTKAAVVVLANCNNGSYDPQINARTIANDIAFDLETDMGLPARTANFRSAWPGLAMFAAAVLLIALRAVWAFRFRRNLSHGKVRRVFSLITYALLDGTLPLAVLIAPPAAFRVSWAFLLNTNPEPAFPLLLASAGLLCVFAVKSTILLITAYRNKTGNKEEP